ncbi:helix-turn-helix transcriptional regulator [Clostridium cadaveris]|uniref:helix-turn-helix transcriptional regulator n=1 Tax=Clostridium cadaveris TaxID=1529 RepID=UPI001459B70D|nr:helix-turn-helix transcriptional regulator [Clostridium cadaveris]NME65662.1 helix-turn-helix transcriptional regulator [Clostridium cadaveris]
MDVNELKSLRIKRGYRQKDIAKVLKINTNSYTKKENNNNPFTVEELILLKKIFNMDDKLFLKIFF